MKKVILLFLILVLSISIKAQSINDSITVELMKLSANNNLIGFAVAIVNRDSIVYAQGFRYSNKETKKPYSIHTYCATHCFYF